MRIVIALPVLNEEKVLDSSVRAVRRFADSELAGHSVTVVISDNGSTDATESIGRALVSELSGVRYLRLSVHGKGLAIREAWASVEADAYVFMDVDLAVDLAALPELVRRIEGGAGLVVGSRYLPKSVVRRTLFRKVLSRGYRAIVGAILETRVSDIPCGFKAANAAIATEVVPLIRDLRWFFDTELVIRAERAGYRIEEVPVTWRELKPAGRKSRVRIIPLIREYFSRVVSLRRELGPRKVMANRPTISGIVASVSPAERAVVVGAALVVASIGLIPPLVAMWSAKQQGLQWTGRQYLSPGDFTVYLSYISQAKNGHLFFENWASSEQLTPVFNILWLKVGWLAWFLRLSPLAAYHVARTLLIFPLAAVAYCALAYVFRRSHERVIGFLAFMFASGVGLYAAPFLQIMRPSAAAYQWPIDFWVAESNAFMTMLYSPHFVASLMLIIAVALLLLLALDAESPEYGAWAGIVALVLFQFHPFHAPTLYVIAFLSLLLRTRLNGIRIGQWIAVALFYAFSAPSVAYYYWLTHWSPNAAFMLQNNVTTTPNLLHVVLGLGIVVPLAAFGWFKSRDEKSLSLEHRQFFAAWTIAQFAMIYSPLVFQRRLIEGLQFPLTVLAVPAVLAFVNAPVIRKRLNALSVGFLAIALFLPSTFSTVVRSVAASSPANDNDAIFFLSHDESSVLAWVRNESPSDTVVLCTLGTGNDVMGSGERRVYVGHWANTVNLPAKLDEVTDFFARMSDDERRAFAKAHGITEVIVGPRERALGGASLREPGFTRQFVSGEYSVYSLND